jgi:[acyl-carrier-protein] S-malonyltransferase
MGRAWFDASPAARRTFEEADEILGDDLGAALSAICFGGPGERLNRTDIAQPAIYTCSVASLRGAIELEGPLEPAAAAGLSLGEYTALHIAGAFGFADGLRLVARRGRLMQEAAARSDSGMVALIGADEAKAQAVCIQAAEGDEVLVCANFNAPGQIVLSGHAAACRRAVTAAERLGVKATPLAVAGAFHSPLMQTAADGMARALEDVEIRPLRLPVWSNVTAEPHDPQDGELLKRRLVEQIVSPVRWAQTCPRLLSLAAGATMECREIAPGSVLRGLMRRIDRHAKVISHDQPQR